MSLVRLTYYVLWLSPALLLGIAVVRMLLSKLHREFPIFFAYAVFQAARTAVQFVVYHQDFPLYFYTYWAGEALSVALGFGVLHEIFTHLFRPYEALQELARLLFRWAAAILILVAVVSAASTPAADSSRLIAGILVLERSVRVVQCGLLFMLFLFSSYFGLTWRHLVFGIAFGFGLYASVQLSALAARAYLGAIGNQTYSLVTSGAYNIAVLIWVTYLYSPQPARRAVQAVPGSNVERWNQALLQLLER